MPKTERATDKIDATPKSTWWIATAYNDNILKLEDASTYPNFVLKVHGGREECPTTEREHFQGGIQCVSQVRMSALLKWLPGCHLEAAKSAEAVRKYCMKSETATGEKTVREQPNKYYAMHDLLIKMAVTAKHLHDEGVLARLRDQDPKTADHEEYWAIASRILAREPHLIVQFTDNRYKSAWSFTKAVWVELAVDCEQALSITEPATEKLAESGEKKSSGISINASQNES